MARFDPIPLGRLTAQLADRVRPLVEAAAELVRTEVVEGMENAPARTGREYPIPGTDSTYTASAPGEPPAIREGIYRDSWKTTSAVVQGSRVSASAYTSLRTDQRNELGEPGASYLIGELLEFGTYKMAPRPHVRPAIDNVQPKIAELVRRASS